MNLATLNSESTYNDVSSEIVRFSRLALFVAVSLLASGCIHLFLLAILGAPWQGPLSLRKPILFGISGGMTMWSVAWVMTQLRPRKLDRLLVYFLSIALFIEVALITLQYWRGVPSHFNRSTKLDASIELTMVYLILFVTGGIFYLTWRSIWLRAIEPAMAIAIRGGMGLLTLACLLGILTSVLGEISLAAGRSSELWGKAGVLKFPHGIGLHAIQVLPILAWLTRRLTIKHSIRIVQTTLAAQLLFVLYAVWQTGQGRDRFDWDSVGGSILAIVVLISLYPAITMTVSIFRAWGERRKTSRILD